MISNFKKRDSAGSSDFAAGVREYSVFLTLLHPDRKTRTRVAISRGKRGIPFLAEVTGCAAAMTVLVQSSIIKGNPIFLEIINRMKSESSELELKFPQWLPPPIPRRSLRA